MNVATVMFEGRSIRGYMGTGGLLVMLDDLPDVFPGEVPSPEFVTGGYGPVAWAHAIIDAFECDPRSIRRSQLLQLQRLTEFLDDEGPLWEAALEAEVASGEVPALMRVKKSMAD